MLMLEFRLPPLCFNWFLRGVCSCEDAGRAVMGQVVASRCCVKLLCFFSVCVVLAEKAPGSKAESQK